MTKRYLKTPEEMIAALQAGKKIVAGDFEYRLVGKVIIAINKTDKSWAVNAGIYLDDVPFIDEPEQLKLEVGKFYKTRAGLKVVVLHIDENSSDGCPVRVAVFDNIYDPYCVKKTGKYTNCVNSVWDIVAPWED